MMTQMNIPKYAKEQLTPKSREELRAILVSLGQPPHHMAKEPSMIESIMRIQNTIQPSDLGEKEESVKAPAPVITLTADEIMVVVQPMIQRGLKVSFLDDGKTWHFKNGVAEDSGSVTIPLTVIEQRAYSLMRARLPARVDVDGVKMLA